MRLFAKPLVLFGIASLLAISVLLLSLHLVEGEIAILGIVFIWISAIPVLAYFAGFDRASVPFMPLVGVFYFAFFALPVFTLKYWTLWPKGYRIYSDVYFTEIESEPILVATLSVFAMFLGFYLFKNSFFKKLPTLKISSVSEPRVITVLLWILMAGHLIFEFSPSLQSISSIGQLASPAGFVAFGGLFLQWRRGNLPLIQSLALLLICLPLEVFWRVRILFLTDILLFVVFLILILWREKFYKMIIALALIGSMIIASYGLTITVRNNPSFAGSFTDKLSFTQKVFSQFILGGEAATIGNTLFDKVNESRVGALARRTGHIWLFHNVYINTPDPVPYWNGETYKPLLTSFIPRLLYADKPKEQRGHEFGVRYNYLPKSDKETSVNIPWLVELQANFPPAGVVLGMAFFGIFLAFLDKTLNAPEAGDLEFVIGTTILFPLFYQESNFSVMVGSILPLFIVLCLYFLIGHKVLAKVFVRRE